MLITFLSRFFKLSLKFINKLSVFLVLRNKTFFCRAVGNPNRVVQAVFDLAVNIRKILDTVTCLLYTSVRQFKQS